MRGSPRSSVTEPASPPCAMAHGGPPSPAHSRLRRPGRAAALAPGLVVLADQLAAAAVLVGRGVARGQQARSARQAVAGHLDAEDVDRHGVVARLPRHLVVADVEQAVVAVAAAVPRRVAGLAARLVAGLAARLAAGLAG